MKLFSSFYQKLTSLLLILSLIPIFLLGAYLFFDATYQEKNSLELELSMHSKRDAENISETIEIRKDLVHSIGNSPLVVGETKELVGNQNEEGIFLTRLELMKKFNNDIVHNKWIEEISILEKESGNTLFHSSIFESKETFKDEKCFIEARKKIPCVSSVKESPIPSKNEVGIYERNLPSFFIFSPIAGEVGLEGVLVVRSTIFGLVEEDEENISDYSNTDHYLVDPNGYFLSKPNFEPLKPQIMKRPELELRMETPETGFSGLFQIRDDVKPITLIDAYKNYAGNQVVGTIAPVKGTDWFYVYEVDATKAYKRFYDIQNSLFISVGLIIVSIILISFLFSRNLVKPLENLRRGISSMAKGSFKEIEVSSSDEFGQLSKEFNSMGRSLDETILELGVLEAKYENLYENSPEMYRTIDNEGKILNTNSVYAKNLGYTDEEVIGKSIFDHTAPESLSAMKESFTTWKNTGSVQNREVWLKRNNGTTFPVLISAVTLYNKEGKIIGSNTVLKDMTDIYKTRKELAEAKSKRLMAIGELSARVAHDLRNPLSVIKNTVTIMKVKKFFGPDSIKYYEMLDRSVSRMTHQIDEVLDYVTPKSLNLKEHSLIEILNEVISRINTPETVTIDLPQNDLKLLCDSEKLEIVFVNLILNAIQAMNNAGKINVRLEDAVDNVTIEVEDTGPGIPDDALPKIFEPLFTTRQVGTGLGLPSCKSIVERHGGTIDVKTILGKGTTFIIKLPKNPPKS